MRRIIHNPIVILCYTLKINHLTNLQYKSFGSFTKSQQCPCHVWEVASPIYILHSLGFQITTCSHVPWVFIGLFKVLGIVLHIHIFYTLDMFQITQTHSNRILCFGTAIFIKKELGPICINFWVYFEEKKKIIESFLTTRLCGCSFFYNFFNLLQLYFGFILKRRKR